MEGRLAGQQEAIGEWRKDSSGAMAYPKAELNFPVKKDTLVSKVSSKSILSKSTEESDTVVR